MPLDGSPLSAPLDHVLETLDCDADAFDALETALNAYLELFAACFGVDRDPNVTVRTAAEALLDTHDAVDTATVLTDVDA